MYSPNYKDGSVVNLMSSIGKALGTKSEYKPLKILKPNEISKSKNIVLIVIDGMGYEYLRRYGKGSILDQYLKGKITSVFPTTTGAAMPTILTGLAPQEHGMTGWFMLIKELGVVAIPILYFPRMKESSLGGMGDIKKLFNLKLFVDRIKADSYIVLKKDVVDSNFSIATTGKAKRVSYESIPGSFKKIEKIIKSSNKKKFIFSYLGDYDHLCHLHGTGSKEVLIYFKRLNKGLNSFVKSIEGTNTTVIITSDHGMIDIPKSKRINLKDHPKFSETLTLPLCGDHRCVYCYVHPSKTKQFEEYVKTEFKNCCEVYKSEDLVKKKYFGLFELHKELINRIGDYVLIMKGNFAIYDFLLNEEEDYNISSHGGMSKEEMYVPLIIIKK